MGEKTAANRRKNEWKHANRRKTILNGKLTKPLHFYSKNMPSPDSSDKRQFRREQRQDDNFENQVSEMFDNE